MSQEELETNRDEIRRLCAEHNLAIVPYGPAWWVVGEGVSKIFSDWRTLSSQDLEPTTGKKVFMTLKEMWPTSPALVVDSDPGASGELDEFEDCGQKLSDGTPLELGPPTPV